MTDYQRTREYSVIAFRGPYHGHRLYLDTPGTFVFSARGFIGRYDEFGTWDDRVWDHTPKNMVIFSSCHWWYPPMNPNVV